MTFRSRPTALLSGTLLADITEFGRSVHAEMDALIAAGRAGVSFREATLFTTTFPCHTCTRHIVAAGIKRVVYIEPYPKSLAQTLHADAIRLVGDDSTKNAGQPDVRIPFEPFVGIGPRRFFDLFSLMLSSGSTIKRKLDEEESRVGSARKENRMGSVTFQATRSDGTYVLLGTRTVDIKIAHGDIC